MATRRPITRRPVEQFAPLAALGLQYYSIRLIDAGGGIKNVMKLTPPRSSKSATWRTNTA